MNYVRNYCEFYKYLQLVVGMPYHAELTEYLHFYSSKPFVNNKKMAGGGQKGLSNGMIKF